jgi:DNA polymerase-3 subunit gamma/tau
MKDHALPEMDQKFAEDMKATAIPVLARAWQILMKGLSEVQAAPRPAQAAEMVLIRLAYAAELPTPGDTIKKLKDAPPAQTASAPSPNGNGGGGGGGSRSMMQSGVTQAVARAAPAPQILEENQPMAALPQNYRELVELFVRFREGGLHGQLYGNVHLVRFERGMLEIRPEASLPPNFSARIGQCLQDWTGQRWMISVSGAAGEPTLAEQDRAAETLKRQQVESHPLVQAVLTAFPGSKITAFRDKILPLETATAEQPETDIPLMEEDSEQ